jgi:hypothetical protein
VNDDAYYFDNDSNYKVDIGKFFVDESKVVFAVPESRSTEITAFTICTPIFNSEKIAMVRVWGSFLSDSTSAKFNPETYRNAQGSSSNTSFAFL